jgi:hypothetical protein
VFWPLLVFGLGTLLMVGFLYESSTKSFSGQMRKTYEERLFAAPERLEPDQMPLSNRQRKLVDVYPEAISTDFRRAGLTAMGVIGLALFVSFFFYKYLASIDMLPQGSIEDKKDGNAGEKQEVMQGNFIPFGPSLALAALIVAFYDPLLRNVAFWFSYYGTTGPVPPLPYHVIGEAKLLPIFVAIGSGISSLTNTLVGNPDPKQR